MWHGQRIAVVVPAFNEAQWIESTLRGIPEFVDRIYVVDDASTDDTSERALALGESRVVVVRHRCNRGVGAAIVTGYLRGLGEDMDVLCVMAGDGQMDPSELPTLLRASQSAEYVKGNRFLHPDTRRMPKLRRLGSRFLSWLTRRTTGLQVDDCQCGYTALRSEIAARLPLAELWPRYGYPNDLLALLAAEGAGVCEVAVAPVYRGENSGLHAGHVASIGFRILGRAWAAPARSKTECGSVVWRSVAARFLNR